MSTPSKVPLAIAKQQIVNLSRALNRANKRAAKHKVIARRYRDACLAIRDLYDIEGDWDIGNMDDTVHILMAVDIEFPIIKKEQYP